MRSYANVVAVVDEVHVDVEAHVGPPGVCDLSVQAMLDRASSSDALGFRCPWPDFTDHAVLLVVNAFKDKLVGAFQHTVQDLDRLPSHAEMEPAALATALKNAHVATLGRVVAGWMSEVRGVRAWDAVKNALPELRPRYERRMREAIDASPDALTTRLLARASSDRPAARVRALAAMALWRAEVLASKLGDAPYRRGHVPPWDPREP
jgi:hypothetical protein